MILPVFLFPLLFLESRLQGDGEMLEFLDGAPGNSVGMEFEAEKTGEGVEDAEAVEPGQATVDEGDHLWLAFAGNMDIDDAAQLSAVGGDDLAADQVFNADDGATGVLLLERRHCLFQLCRLALVPPLSSSQPQSLSQGQSSRIARVFHAIPSIRCQEASGTCGLRSSVLILLWHNRWRARAGAA